MKTHILFEDKHSWAFKKVNSHNVFFKGVFWFNDKFYSKKLACEKLAEIFKGVDKDSDIKKNKILDHITGHFAFIISNDKYTFAMVDRIRSIPLYFHKHSNSLYISNSASKIKSKFSISNITEDALLQFKMSGYTLGHSTLFEGLNQLMAGKYIFSDNNCDTLHVENYFRYFVDQFSDQNEDELLAELHDITLSTFSKMIESFDGAPVFIPLSGGYDSRLILSLLKELQYDNVTTYTYGLKGLWEVKRARYIAEKLKTKWIFVEFKPKLIKNYYYTNDRKEFFNFAAGYNSTPHLAEYYALLELRKKKLIPDNAIIINGQSGDFTSGGHLPNVLLGQDNLNLNISSFTDTIIDKHFSLWKNLKSKRNTSNIANCILASLEIGNRSSLTQDEFAKYYEFFECQERQSKFVVNGQRAYDWHGYDWRLPFWDDELMKFWMKVDWKVKFGQQLMIKYLKRYNYGGVFNNSELPPQFPYYPLWVKFAKPIIHAVGKLSNKKLDYYHKKYLQYFMTYSPTYPQTRYSDYLKDSQWHRNPVSYWSQYILKEIKNEDSIYY